MTRNYLADAASELAAAIHETRAPSFYLFSRKWDVAAAAPEWVFSVIRRMREDGHMVDYCAYHAHAIAERLRDAALADQDLVDAAERYQDETPPSDTYILLWAAHNPTLRNMAMYVSRQHDAIWDDEDDPVTILRQVYYHCLLFWSHMVRRAIEDRAGEMRVQEVLQ